MAGASTMPIMWSPRPVVGFRYWRIDLDGLYGVRGHRWPRPHLEAVCRRGISGEVPHLSGDCGRPPCGVYALKDPQALVASFGRDLSWSSLVWSHSPLLEPGAYGVVELTGRVIEHQRGYRAAEASVRSLIVVGPRWVGRVADRSSLERVFADPFPNLRSLAGEWVDDLRGGWQEARLEVVRGLLETAEEEPWISAKSSE